MAEVTQTNFPQQKSSYPPNMLSFAFSLIGGILMVISGIMFGVMMLFGGSTFGMMSNWGGMMGGMMGGHIGMMGSINFPLRFMWGLGLIGLVAGIIVIISSVMVYVRPFEQRSWGVLLIVFSFLSFAGMGGFWLGGILGLVGGILALSNYRPVPI